MRHLILSCPEWQLHGEREALVRAPRPAVAQAWYMTPVRAAPLLRRARVGHQRRRVQHTGHVLWRGCRRFWATRAGAGAPQSGRYTPLRAALFFTFNHLYAPCSPTLSSQARIMDETGREDISVILRLKRSAALRKESMMVLAREWGYKGNIWQRGLSSVGVTTPVLRPHRRDWDFAAPAGTNGGGGVMDASMHSGEWRPVAPQPVPRQQRQQHQQQHSGGDARGARGESGTVRAQRHHAGLPMSMPYGTGPLPPPAVDPMATATAAAVNAAFQAHMAAAQQQQQQQALYRHLAAASQQNGWFGFGAGFDATQQQQLLHQQQQQQQQQQQHSAGVLEMAALCDSMRQAGRETAVVWEKVVARASEQQLAQQREAHRAAGGRTCDTLCCQAEGDPALASIADDLSHNAIACAVAHWLRGVAAAHGAALAEEAVALGGGGALNMAAAVVLMRQATELVASRQASLEAVRSAVCAHLATQGLTGVRVVPGAAAQSAAATPTTGASADGAAAAASGDVEPSLQWLRCCARLLDDVLTWLAHAKTYASGQFGASALVCSTLVARLSEAFFSAAEETLTLRRQWLALSLLELQRQRGGDVATGGRQHGHHGADVAEGSSGETAPEFEAETCVAVVNAVLQTFAQGPQGQEPAAGERAAAAVAAAHEGGADAQA